MSVAENTGDEWSCAYVRSPGRGACLRESVFWERIVRNLGDDH